MNLLYNQNYHSFYIFKFYLALLVKYGVRIITYYILTRLTTLHYNEILMSHQLMDHKIYKVNFTLSRYVI